MAVPTPGSCLHHLPLAALAGLPVSLLLSGNPDLNFSRWRGTAWTAHTLGLGLLLLANLLWAFVDLAQRRQRRR